MFNVRYNPKRRLFIKAAGTAVGGAALATMFPGVAKAAEYVASPLEDNSAYVVQNSGSWRNLPLISTPRGRPCPYFVDLEDPGRGPNNMERALARDGPEADRLEERVQIMSDQGPIPATVSTYKGIVKVKLDRTWTGDKLGKYTFILKTVNPAGKHTMQTKSNGIAVIKLGQYDTYVDPATGIIRPQQIQIVTNREKVDISDDLSKNPGAIKTVVTYDVNPDGKSTFIQHSIPEQYVFNPESGLWEKSPMELAGLVLNHREGLPSGLVTPSYRPELPRDDHSLTFNQQKKPITDWQLVLDKDFEANSWTREFIEEEFIPAIHELMGNGIEFQLSYSNQGRNIESSDDIPEYTIYGSHNPNLAVNGVGGAFFSDGTNRTGTTVIKGGFSLRDDGPATSQIRDQSAFSKVLTQEFCESVGGSGENEDFDHPNSWNDKGYTNDEMAPKHWDQWLIKTNSKTPRGSKFKKKKIV